MCEIMTGDFGFPFDTYEGLLHQIVIIILNFCENFFKVFQNFVAAYY